MFVLLTVPVISTIVAADYVTSQSIAEENATELVKRFRSDAVDDIKHAIDPISSLIRSASVLGAEQPKFYFEKARCPTCGACLRHSGKMITATYVGLARQYRSCGRRGSFPQTRRSTVSFRRIVPDTRIAGSSRKADRLPRPTVIRFSILGGNGNGMYRAADALRPAAAVLVQTSGLKRERLSSPIPTSSRCSA